MIDALKPYPAYKESGLPWIGRVPEHWSMKRMRRISDMLVSNIDKHTKADELPVRLCNYVDVYKNERIDKRIPFMRATASAQEIERFRLRVGDVIITKDSEEWTDIGVPALVGFEAPDLVCGYHLAVLRPGTGSISGAFLLRALQTQGIAAQFHIEANGVTRYGLSHGAIRSVCLPVPPPNEQDTIVRFLDWANERLEQAIRVKRKVVTLLNEQKQAIIQRAVTRGLEPAVQLKASGLHLLQDFPSHWEVRPAKRFYREIDDRSETGAEELLSVSHITGVTPRATKNVTMFMADSYVGHKLCEPGDLVINTMWAWMAALGVSKQVGIVSPSYAVYRPLDPSAFDPQFADWLLRTRPYVSEYICRSTGIRSSRLRLYPEQFLKIPVVRPPLSEQQAIVEYVTRATGDLDLALRSVAREIELLKEYRTRLIADVVTGKLDVREIRLPARSEPETEELEAMDEDVEVETNEDAELVEQSSHADN